MVRRRTVNQAIQARWIITVDSEERNDNDSCTIFEDHTILLDTEGAIYLIVENEEFESSFAKSLAKENITRLSGNQVLVPGFVNAHTHGAMILMRGLCSEPNLHSWLKKAMYLESDFVNPESVKIGTVIAAYEALLTGTTCINDQYYKPEAMAEAYEDVGIRAFVGPSLIDKESTRESVTVTALEKYIKHIKDKPYLENIYFAANIHSFYTVSYISVQELSEVLVDSKYTDITEGKPLCLHYKETHDEEALILAKQKKLKKKPLEYLQDLGLLNPNLLLVHSNWLDKNEKEAVMMSGVNLCNCPRSNSRLSTGQMDLQWYLDEGVNVCLGTDSALSGGSMDMMMEMQTAFYIHRAKPVTKSKPITEYTVLKMATINGAKALGLGDVTGSLVPGKKGDIVSVQLEDIINDVSDPLHHLVVGPHRKVTNVWVGGRKLVNNGQIVDDQRDKEMMKRMAYYRKSLKESADDYDLNVK